MKMDEKREHGSVGDYLYNLGTWASFPVQMVGYLPLSAQNHFTSSVGSIKSLKFTWVSIFPYFSVFLTVASLTWCLVFVLRHQEFQAFIEFKSPTESAAFNLMIFATTLSSVYGKLFGLINRKKYEKFWEKTRILLGNFSHVPDPKDLKPPEKFQQIRKSCKREFFFMIIPLTIHVIYFYAWEVVASILDDLQSESSAFSNTDTQLYIGLGFGYLLAFLHVSNGIWMNFFVKIYSQCLLSISEELKELRKLYGAKNNMGLALSPNPLTKTQPYPGRGNSYGDSNSQALSLHLNLILDKLAQVNRELHRFDKFFGSLLLLQVGNCVANLLVFSFFACLWMGRGKWKDGFLETVVPLYLYGKELLEMGSVAEKLGMAADEVLNALAEDVVLDNLSEEIYLRIQIMSSQLCTKPPVISARQFFVINRSLVTSVMSALATFLVVLVNFKDQEDDAKPTILPAVVTTSRSNT